MPTSRADQKSRKQSRGVATRRKILRAAERRFSSDGYDATSMTDVAEACGVAPGSVYYHFQDKHALLLALMDDFLRLVSNMPSDVLPLEAFLGTSPRTSIETWLRRSFQVLEKRPSIYLVMLGMAENDSELRERRLRIDAVAIERLSHMIRLGQEQGRFRSGDDPTASAFFIHHSIEMAVTQLLVRGSGTSSKVNDTDLVLGSLSKMICRYLLEDDSY